MRKEKMTFITALTFSLILIPLLSLAQDKEKPIQENEKIEGVIDIDYPELGSPKVEINLSGALLSMGIEPVPEDKSEIKKFLADLKAIKVKIYEKERLSVKNVDDIIKFYDDILAKNKWESIARINDDHTRVNISLLKKKDKEDSISGMLVFVVDEKEIIIVNLAGNINIAKLPELAKMSGFNFDIRKFGEKKAKNMQESTEPSVPSETEIK